METDEDDYFLEPEYGYEDLTFLEACMDGDLDAMAAIIDDNPTEEEINERDRCGRVKIKLSASYFSILATAAAFCILTHICQP